MGCKRTSAGRAYHHHCCPSSLSASDGHYPSFDSAGQIKCWRGADRHVIGSLRPSPSLLRQSIARVSSRSAHHTPNYYLFHFCASHGTIERNQRRMPASLMIVRSGRTSFYWPPRLRSRINALNLLSACRNVLHSRHPVVPLLPRLSAPAQRGATDEVS